MTTRIRNIVFLLLMLVQSGYALAQEATGPASTPANDSIELASTDTLPQSAYELNVPKHTQTFYSMHLGGILFTILLILMAFVSYRYWNDNRAKRNAADSTNS